MHRRTRQRLSERVARLEERVDRPHRDQELFDALPRIAATEDLGDEYAAAWREYLRRRAEIEARGDRPPADYETGRPETERAFWWRAWDHPDLQPPIRAMIPILGAWVRRRIAEIRANESGEPNVAPEG
jgi:hypothetical protein